jgi:hypothetical protein
MSGMTRRAALVGMAGMAGGVGGLVGCGGGGSSFKPDGPPSGSFLGKTPPSLEAGGTWLNADAPMTIPGLAGSVVLLEFSFLQ